MMNIVTVRLLAGVVIGAVVVGLNSCLPLAAGAAAGYIAHEEGYRVQSPLKKVD